jgi:uncharacterized protein (DUF427 family)
MPGPGDPRYWDLDPGRGKQGGRVQADRAIRQHVQDDRNITDAGPDPTKGHVAAWSTIGRPPPRLPWPRVHGPPPCPASVGRRTGRRIAQADWYEPKPTNNRNSEVAGVVELVMTPGHTISIVPTVAHVEVRLGGRLLATTDRAMKLDETGLPTRYYLPPDDVQMDLLRPTTFHTNCPFKGEASYWSLDIDGKIHDGIVWSYETPTAQAAEVRGMLSFYPDRTEVTVDGQSLRD